MRQKATGNITMALALVILVTFIGLSLLSYSLAHSKISYARSGKALKTGQIYQAIILYLHQFKETITAVNFQEIKEPAIHYFNSQNFPSREIDQCTITPSFSFTSKQTAYYKEIWVTNRLEARRKSSNYAMGAETVIQMLDGCIPLTLVPVFIDKETPQKGETFLQENQIEVDDDEVVIEEVDTEIDTQKFLSGALKIQGTAVTWAHIRERFGFEICNKPIEEGAYILVQEGIIETLFVQGDVEKLIFSTGLTSQEIRIFTAGNEYEISYRPGEDYFYSSFPHIPTCSLFNENLVINGNAWSIEQAGGKAFYPGTNIKLLVSGKAVITSSLESDQIELGKIPSTNLTLVTKGTGAIGNQDQEAGIVIDAGEKAAIQATLISAGKVKNMGGEIHLTGSLYATDIENLGILEVDYATASFDSAHFFKTGQFRYIRGFFIQAIEEIYNEN